MLGDCAGFDYSLSDFHNFDSLCPIISSVHFVIFTLDSKVTSTFNNQQSNAGLNTRTYSTTAFTVWIVVTFFFSLLVTNQPATAHREQRKTCRGQNHKNSLRIISLNRHSPGFCPNSIYKFLSFCFPCYYLAPTRRVLHEMKTIATV